MKELLGGMTEGVVASNRIILRKSGPGKVNAAITAVEMILSYSPDCIISTGCAGGLSSGLKLLDVVAASESVYHDVDCKEPNEYGQMQGMPARFVSDPGLLERALKNEGVKSGLIATGDLFCTEKEEAMKILSHFPDAIAIDMESAAIAQACHIKGVPFLSLRVISDTVDSEDRASEYYDFWSSASERSLSVLKSFLQSC